MTENEESKKKDKKTLVIKFKILNKNGGKIGSLKYVDLFL
jgi:hypothetical protein